MFDGDHCLGDSWTSLDADGDRIAPGDILRETVWEEIDRAITATLDLGALTQVSRGIT